jgi:3,5-epimerase/4-reductase
MKLLVYGSNGWIGSQFCRLLQEKQIEYYEGFQRTENYKELLNEIYELSPTHIISFIGRTHGGNITTIDYLEQKGKLVDNVRDNLYGPLNLVLISERLNIHYTYLGTGCIFNSDKDHKEFLEKDKPNFFGSSYSIVKGFTDQIMHSFNVLNLRIRMPINDDLTSQRNFISKIISYDKICSIPNSMTVLNDMLPIMLDMLQKKTIGTYNMCNSGVISHDEILTMYRDIIDSSFTWKNMTLEEQNQILKSERSNNKLNTDKLSKMYPELADIHTSVRKILYKIRYNLDHKSEHSDEHK